MDASYIDINNNHCLISINNFLQYYTIEPFEKISSIEVKTNQICLNKNNIIYVEFDKKLITYNIEEGKCDGKITFKDNIHDINCSDTEIGISIEHEIYVYNIKTTN